MLSGDIMNKNNVISFVASDKTQEMMTEELNWCMRDKTPQYAKWQAKDGDTVITLYESGKVVFQGKDADLASDFWVTTEKINNGKVDVKNSGDKKKKDKLDKTSYVNPRIYNSSSLGSDEVGTGDYFDLTMEIDLIFKIAAVGIIVSILNQVLSRSGREEQATMTTLTGLVVVLMIVAQKIAELFELVKNLFGL